MADLVDVSAALLAIAATAVYPNGTGQPSIANTGVRLYQGWPLPEQLDADMAAGVCHVSIYPRGEERNTSRYPKDWQQVTVGAPTLTLSQNGQQVTVGGTVSTPQNVSLLVNGSPYLYAVQPADTLASIAAALAALIAAAVPGTTSAGAVITLPNSARIGALRVGVSGTNMREVRRTERVFQITTWADTPAHRDAIAGVLDAALAGLNFLTLADGSAARLIYKSSPVSDAQQKAQLYRRDLLYSVEYGTFQTSTDTQVMTVQEGIQPMSPGASGDATVGAVRTVFN